MSRNLFSEKLEEWEALEESLLEAKLELRKSEAVYSGLREKLSELEDEEGKDDEVEKMRKKLREALLEVMKSKLWVRREKARCKEVSSAMYRAYADADVEQALALEIMDIQTSMG